MSALADVFGLLGELSESELRQLYLAIGVRLGIPDVPVGAKPQQKGRGKTTNTRSKGGKPAASNTSSKGNPKRKSQWANHPLYQEYSRLKKVVEAQSKEQKCSFNAVDTAESRAYQEAFTHWVEAKSSFRGHGESGQLRDNPEKEEGSEDEQEEEKPAVKPAVASTSKQAKLASPPGAKPVASAGSGRSPTPVASTGKGKAPAK
jgi:hypothetical protein